MRRTHLRGHTNILKRLLVHVGGFNLGLFMRTLVGVGTPRGLQGRSAAALAVFVALWAHLSDVWNALEMPSADHRHLYVPTSAFRTAACHCLNGAVNHGLLV
jgi:hypothetical protein